MCKLDNAPRKAQTLASRRKVPSSLVLTGCVILGLQYSSGLLISIESVIPRWKQNALSSVALLQSSMNVLSHGPAASKISIIGMYILLSCNFYVFFVSPFRAGMWTGERAKKHFLHRYLGLAYLIQYPLAWIEYSQHYDTSYVNSVTPHLIALNGIIQGISAYFSFAVLPALKDPGYYSDKAVLSRDFVHENIYFQLQAVFGSIYYNDYCRQQLRSNVLGRILEVLFVFFPYIILRPLFPFTRFSDSGTKKAGRSEKHQKFYEVGTLMVKIFYLWAKYFLGFYINFLVFLEKPSSDTWKFIRGLYLLNLGTVSLSIFLHTLRFRKVLPPKLTFSIYLIQIYATFLGLPYLYETFFVTNKWLSLLPMIGIAFNLTRKRSLHLVWCIGCFCLLNRARSSLE